MKKNRGRLIGNTTASVVSRLSRAVAGRGFGNQKNRCYLQLTREQWRMSIADGLPYFPLFAGKDAKFASMKAWSYVETLDNGKITEQTD